MVSRRPPSTRSISRSSPRWSAAGRAKAFYLSFDAPLRRRSSLSPSWRPSTLMLAVLWDRSPFLSAALVGPLAAIALYQRSVFRELAAIRLALTDPLTGLGNHRHFHERLDRELGEAEDKGLPLSVCILDIDNFKAERLARAPEGRPRPLPGRRAAASDGEAFRIGGDEFALLLPGRDEREALSVADGVFRRVSLLRRAWTGRPSVAGVVTYPQLGLDRSGDRCGGRPGAVPRQGAWKEPRARTTRSETSPRFQASVTRPTVRHASGPPPAWHAVDARDAYTGRHSYVVAGSPRGSPTSWASTQKRSSWCVCRQPPRSRQAGDPGGDPAEAQASQRVGAARPAPASTDRVSRMLRSPWRRARLDLGSSTTTSAGTAAATRTG